MRADVAKLLVEASAIEMVSESGTAIEVWTISAEGPLVRASAPRLAVAEGMALGCRLVVDGMPHRVRVVVEEASVQSEKRAALQLLVTEVVADGGRRASERIEFTATAHLTASICDRIVPGDRLVGRVVDLSESGIGISMTDTRPRPRDLLRLEARFLEGLLSTDVRVMRTSAEGRGDIIVAGCAFVGLPADGARVVAALLERLGRPQRRDPTGVRDALLADAEPADTARRQLPIPRPLAQPG